MKDFLSSDIPLIIYPEANYITIPCHLSLRE